MTFAVDSSAMIAAVCAWHEHHAAALDEINARLDRGERLAVPAHALLEAYAVLTRLPAPHRLGAAEAWSVVDGSFSRHSAVKSLAGPGYIRLLRHIAANGISGGRSYDALIGECAKLARASVLVTLNPRHFDPPPAGVAIVDPARTERRA